MPKSFSIWPLTEPGAAIRLGVVVLLVANLVALGLLIWPPQGSPSDLKQQALDLRTQLARKQASLQRTRKLAEKIETGRDEGTEFVEDYFLTRRTAYSEVLAELTQSAADAGVRPKESAYATQDIEGSDVFSMMQISASFEGAYPNLVKFVNLLDKSDNLLIIEGLNATPQQGSNLLNVTLKLDTFVRDDGSGQ